MPPLLLRDESELLRTAREEIERQAYISGLTAARLTAYGHDVARLELRLMAAVWR